MLFPVFNCLPGPQVITFILQFARMQTIIENLEATLTDRLPQLLAIPEDVYSAKPNPAKWSKKEILGHLVDSAQANIRRFVVAQYESQPYIVYNQDKWVTASGYQQWPVEDIIRLWFLLNKQICEILKNMSPDAAQRICLTESPHKLEWLAADYIRHLQHHLHVILDLEPINYP